MQALQRDGTDGRPPLLSRPLSIFQRTAAWHHGTKKESFQGHAAWRRRADALAFTAGHFQICQIGARGSRNDVVRSVMAPGAEISAGLASAASLFLPMGSTLHCGFTGDSHPPHLLRKVLFACFAQASQLPSTTAIIPSPPGLRPDTPCQKLENTRRRWCH